MDIQAKRILILDFGSQYTQLIARRIRELGVYCEIHPFSLSASAIREYNPAGIILTGGPETVTVLNAPRASDIVFTLGCPVLGICYGMQVMGLQLGGDVKAGTKREFGYAQVMLQEPSPLLTGLHDQLSQDVELLDVWMSHGDQVSTLPPSFKAIASTHNSKIAAMADESHRFYGLQFHPEVSHTK